MSDISNPKVTELISLISNLQSSDLSSEAKQILSDFESFFSLMDFRGDFIFANKKWQKVFEMSTEEVNEQSLLSIINKTDYNKAHNLINEIGQRNNPVEVVNLSFISGTEQKIDCCAGFYPVDTKDGKKIILNVIHEFNSEIQQEKLTSQQSRFILSIMNNIPNPVYYKNLNGIFLGCNKKFEEFINKPLAEIFGKASNEIFSEKFAMQDAEKDTLLLSDLVAQKYESEIEFEDGNYKNILISKSVFFDDNDKPGGIIGSFSDITERIIAEKALKESEEKVREANATKDKFLTIVSHDLKNPFTTLLGFSEMLIQEYESFDEEEKYSFLEEINKSARHAYKLLENLLQWSRAHTGRITNEPQKLVLTELIWKVADNLKEDFMKKKVRFFVEVGNDITAFADKNMVVSIIGNLLSNAIKFSESNGKVTISAKAEGNNISVSVKDEGIGMTEDDIAKLFRIDVHYVSIGPAKEKGTGLGLILCKEFLDRIGGKITVNSIFGEGTEFTFSLPLCE